MISYLFHYTFPELLTARETINDEQGLIWAGDVRKYDMQQPGYDVRLWKAWQQSFKTRKEIPPKAMAYFQETKHLTRPPKAGDRNIMQNGPINEELIPAIKPFSWSHSAISDFDTCPYQYAHKRIYKTIPYEETEATIWGTRVHKVAEDAVNGEPVVDEEAFSIVAPYVDLFLKKKAAGATVLVEHQMGLTEDWKACGFKEGCGRIISDVLVIDGNKVGVFDYKTGKRRDKQGNPKTISNDQLIINCIAAAIHYPDAQEFNGKYIYVSEQDPKFKTPGFDKPLSRAELLPHLKVLTEKIARMKEAIAYDNYKYQPSGLCRGWCKIPECPHKRG